MGAVHSAGILRRPIDTIYVASACYQFDRAYAPTQHTTRIVSRDVQPFCSLFNIMSALVCPHSLTGKRAHSHYTHSARAQTNTPHGLSTNLRKGTVTREKVHHSFGQSTGKAASQKQAHVEVMCNRHLPPKGTQNTGCLVSHPRNRLQKVPQAASAPHSSSLLQYGHKGTDQALLF